MDIPKNANKINDQIKMFYEMNDCVIKYGGKIYLGKTPVLTKDHFFMMYDNLDKFLAIKEKFDPNNLFESNMFRRIIFSYLLPPFLYFNIKRFLTTETSVTCFVYSSYGVRNCQPMMCTGARCHY